MNILVCCILDVISGLNATFRVPAITFFTSQAIRLIVRMVIMVIIAVIIAVINFIVLITVRFISVDLVLIVAFLIDCAQMFIFIAF